MYKTQKRQYETALNTTSMFRAKWFLWRVESGTLWEMQAYAASRESPLFREDFADAFDELIAFERFWEHGVRHSPRDGVHGNALGIARNV